MPAGVHSPASLSSLRSPLILLLVSERVYQTQPQLLYLSARESCSAAYRPTPARCLLVPHLGIEENLFCAPCLRSPSRHSPACPLLNQLPPRTRNRSRCLQRPTFFCKHSSMPASNARLSTSAVTIPPCSKRSRAAKSMDSTASRSSPARTRSVDGLICGRLSLSTRRFAQLTCLPSHADGRPLSSARLRASVRTPCRRDCSRRLRHASSGRRRPQRLDGSDSRLHLRRRESVYRERRAGGKSERVHPLAAGP